MCIGVIEMRDTHDALNFAAGMCQVLDNAGLTQEGILVFLTDHEAAIRKAAAELALPLGCGCHGLQLPLQKTCNARTCACAAHQL